MNIGAIYKSKHICQDYTDTILRYWNYIKILYTQSSGVE